MSTNKLLLRDEKKLNSPTLESLSAILDSLDALVYVSTFDSHELIFINKHGRDTWGQPEGKKCHELLQDRDKPCEFCTNPLLLDGEGKPTGVYVWEFQNLVTKRWYQCRDEAIPWIDGRMVRIEIAIDITERKEMELELIEAKETFKRLANTDVLTNIMNRRAFTEAAERVISHSSRHNHQFAMVLMDIDYFKKFNDQYGHTAGDDVLIKVTELITCIVRKEDLFARFGGEEFILLLPNTNSDKALRLLKRIQEDLKTFSIKSVGDNITLTMSYGITLSSPDKGLDQLIHEADSALYQAKDNGRNKIEIYTSESQKNQYSVDDSHLSSL